MRGLRRMCKHRGHFLGRPLPLTGLGTPSVQAFEEVLEMTRRAVVTGKGLKNVGGYQKIRKIQYCLAEAVRDRDRAFMRRCKSVAMHADSNGRRYACRFSAASQTLAVRN